MRDPDRPAPRLPLALLRALLSSRPERDEILADVVAEHAARVARAGPTRARRWLWRQALGSIPALLAWRWRRASIGFERPASAFRPGDTMLRTWLTDAHYAARRLRARPGYVLIAALTLALGVGGTAAVYGIARGLLFDPLPFAHEREVGVFWKKTDWTELEFIHIRGRTPGFSQIALYRNGDQILQEAGAPARFLRGLAASAELFDVLGARPLHGRGFRAGDDLEGAEPVTVLSFGLWRELGADPSLVGRRLTLNGTPRTVVGVMPPGFWFPDPTVRIWTPVSLIGAENWNSTLVGRVAPGHDVRAMATPVGQLVAILDERFDYPAQWDKTVDPRITPIRDDIVVGMRPALLTTLGAMGLILLIACANVAALMLGQMETRSSELAVRLALGANRRRLTQQLVAEALLIALGASALGASLAWGGFRVLTSTLPLGVWAQGAAPDWTVFGSAMGIAFAAALLVVLVPAAALWRGDLRPALGRARTGGLEGRGGRLESGLVVVEVALAVLVASGAALLTRSVANLYALDPGVRTEGVGVLDVTIPPGGGLVRQRRAVADLTAAVAALPGVGAAGAVQILPLRGGGYNLPISVEGGPDTEGQSTEFRVVTPGYLEAMGFELIDGRAITEADDGDAELVVVINQALAQKYFAGTDPVGHRIGDGITGSDGNERRTRVVGVVANAAERSLTDEAVPVRYVALSQMAWVDGRWSVVLRAAPGTEAIGLLDAARREVGRAAPGVPVTATTTMSRVLDGAVGPARQVMSLLSLLTALALTLGTVGIYGVIAHFAARRRREWAIRIALGLPRSRAMAHVVGHGVLLAAVGITLGLAAAAALARVLSSFLYGVAALDPLAFAIAATSVLAVGTIAAFLPARRAGMTDPVIVLREQ